MTIPSLNEQLLRAVGVGVALFGGPSLELRYANETFHRWFEDEAATDCASLFPRLDLQEMRLAIGTGERYTSEVHRRRRRRTLVLSLIFSQAIVAGEPLVILECQNITRIRELEAMLESYATMVERRLAEVERERDGLQGEILDLVPGGTVFDGSGRIVVKAERVTDANVLVASISPSTPNAQASPSEMLAAIGAHHAAFARIGEPLGCVQVRTIGSTYLGLARGPADQALPALIDAAAMFLRYLERLSENEATAWSGAIGIGHGEVIAGVVGGRSKVYNVLGSAERQALAARNAAKSMEVRLSPEAMQALGEGSGFPFPIRMAPDGPTAIVDVDRRVGS